MLIIVIISTITKKKDRHHLDQHLCEDKEREPATKVTSEREAGRLLGSHIFNHYF